MSVFVPPIKCQGIKTKLVPWISENVPGDFDGIWIEPFAGSGVVAFNVRPKRVLLADTNPHIVGFYRAVQDKTISSSTARLFLADCGRRLSKQGESFYFEIRERFNSHGDPLDFLFLNRACFNGLIRFNKNGEFNVPFCQKPDRFSKAYITKICNQIEYVAQFCSVSDVSFVCQSFEKTIAAATVFDMLYCDPPYIGRHTDYFNGWTEANEHSLHELLRSTPSRFLLSTWKENEFRNNPFFPSLEEDFRFLTRNHYYHLGAAEENRHPMVEALFSNFELHAGDSDSAKKRPCVQLSLFDSHDNVFLSSLSNKEISA